MNTRIEKLKFNELSDMIFNPSIHQSSSAAGELSISRIHRMSHHLRIDFVYRSSSRYFKGGWISMEPDCYVESVDHLFKCTLVQADNISLAPKRTYFSRQGQLWTFTLWFTPLPDFVSEINFIEKLNGTPQRILQADGSIEELGNYFNFFGIQLSSNNYIELQIGQN